MQFEQAVQSSAFRLWVSLVACFKILSAEKAATLAPVNTDLAGSHLKLGIVYAHEGLLDDAEQEFRAAIAAREDPALARKLLQSVRQMRR